MKDALFIDHVAVIIIITHFIQLLFVERGAEYWFQSSLTIWYTPLCVSIRSRMQDAKHKLQRQNSTLPMSKELLLLLRRPSYTNHPGSRVFAHNSHNTRGPLLTLSLLSLLPRQLLSDTATTGSPPHITTPSQQPLGGRNGPIDGRSHIQIEDRLTRRFRGTRIIINHISHLLLSALLGFPPDEPIMAIKRRVVWELLGPHFGHEIQHSRFGRHISWSTLESDEFWFMGEEFCFPPSHLQRLQTCMPLVSFLSFDTVLPRFCETRAESTFPTSDFFPRAFV